MKKIYIKPRVKTINMQPVRPLAVSAEQVGWDAQLSRKASEGNSWDDDEDEIEDSMWK